MADAAYLASYCSLGAALVIYGGDGDTHPRARFHALLDGAAVLVIALLVVWQSSVHSTLTDPARRSRAARPGPGAGG